MATLCQLHTKPPCPAKRSSPASPSCPFHPAQARAPLSTRTQKRTPAISCSAKNENNQNDSASVLNRRDVLMGLTGLYGTAAISGNPIAKAAPVETPEISNCGSAKLPDGAVPTSCCPPKSTKAAKLFTPPGLDTPLRVRPAAHLVDKAYIEKFSEALRRMKALPADDPRSFMQQAMVHCAYCDGSYQQVGLPDIEVQVHGNWLFFPFHRAYLYFFERILGKLIDDPTFAMPYWNWDAAAGMKMPAMYTNPRLPMFSPFRNPDHMPPKLVDLDFLDKTEHSPDHENFSDEEMVEHNLYIMYRQMRTNSSTPEAFFGDEYRAGMKAPEKGAGSMENMPHNTLHDWVGDPLQPNRENMGNLYSSGRDPLFYAHHTNVDRMWNIWKTLGRRNVDICDPDYLNTSFMLYDENADLVQITVADTLNSELYMRYKFQDVPLEWLDKKPKVRSTTSSLVPRPNLKTAQFPLVLDEPVRTTMRRSKTNRSGAEKKMTEEILKISGIKLNRDVRGRFDVFVNANNYETLGAEDREYIGTFTNVPHKHKHNMMGMGIETSIQFCLTEVIDDLGANGDETIEVTLVPRHGVGQITISAVNMY